MPPFQERWARLLNQTLPHSPLKSTETVQRSCVTLNVTRGAAQTPTGEDNAAEPSSSVWRLVSTVVPRSCRGESVIWQFIRKKKGLKENGRRIKWMRLSAGSHAVFWVRCLLACFVYCYGGHGCGGEGRANSACGIVSLAEKRGGKIIKREFYLYLIHFLIYTF